MCECELEVTYTYTGNRSEAIQAGLDSWKHTNVVFKRVPAHGTLSITHNPTEDFSSNHPLGLFDRNHILISERYNLTDSQLVGLISHEAGHFFSIPHNQLESVMNVTIPLEVKRPSAHDVKSAKWYKFKLLLVKLFD